MSIKDRFTHSSDTERGRIRSSVRQEIYERDNYTCQFCDEKLPDNELTIDHLITISKEGRDEITNYVTCCEECNQKKADMPLREFASAIDIEVEELPVHGDPVIDNEELPDELRMIRKRIYDKMRKGERQVGGSKAQKKIEKEYRRSFWETEKGEELKKEFPSLPGHVRIMIPEIKTIAESEKEYLLLVEFAKSASTRNLIGTTLTEDQDIVEVARSLKEEHGDDSVRKRVNWAWDRFMKEVRKRNLD